MNVKNGRGTRFWIDKWCSKVHLEKLFPQLFTIVQYPSGTVCAHWSAGSWNIKVPNVHQEELFGIRAELLQMLPDHIPLNDDERDRLAWIGTRNKCSQSKMPTID